MSKAAKVYALQLKRGGKWMPIPFPMIGSLTEARDRARNILADTRDDVEEIRIVTFTQTNVTPVVK